VTLEQRDVKCNLMLRNDIIKYVLIEQGVYSNRVVINVSAVLCVINQLNARSDE